jgi:hypothetical protein
MLAQMNLNLTSLNGNSFRTANKTSPMICEVFRLSEKLRRLFHHQYNVNLVP